jgi:3-oxosteroid 1-dehydrogenase
MTAQEFDVVVVGSGAAGMVAALTAAHQGLKAVVLEKAAHFGGSTARSGGGVWIPNNEILKRDGVTDTADAARSYLHTIVGDVVPPEKIDTYLQHGPEMLSFVLKHTPLKMCWVPGYSDYYPEQPGGRPAGRSIEPQPFDAKRLGPDMAGLEPAYGKVPLNVVVMQQDYVRLNQMKRHPRGILRSIKVGVRTAWAGMRGKNLVGMGRALIAPLRIGLRDAGVPVLLNTALTDLYVEDGVVQGVYVRDMTAPESAEPRLIRARRGVILGSGGFEHNESMRRKYQREPIGTGWTVGAAANTGDGILAAEKLGAAMDLMEDAWWGPTVPLEGAPWFALSERNSPGSMIVNMAGERFMNESMPYVEACHHMYGGEYGQGPGPGENVPAWLIFDQRYRDRYIFAGLQPGQRIPKKWMESGVIVKAESIEVLAAATGIPAQALSSTVARFNGFARSGVDEDFHRGDSAYDRYYGDQTGTG